MQNTPHFGVVLKGLVSRLSPPSARDIARGSVCTRVSIRVERLVEKVKRLTDAPSCRVDPRTPAFRPLRLDAIIPRASAIESCSTFGNIAPELWQSSTAEYAGLH
jgi:hypothetical protein